MTENYWTRMRKTRLSRRSLLGASARAGVGAAGLALVGCGDDDDDDSASAQAADQAADQTADQAVADQGALLPGELTAEEEAANLPIEEELRLRYHWSKLANLPGQAEGPQYGGHWVFGSTDPGTFNPLGPTGALLAAFALYFMNQLVSFPVGDFDNNNYVRPEGDLATGWESPEPETWIFQVNQDVKWQDVDPLNGRDMTMEDIAKGYDALREAPVQARDYEVIDTIVPDESGRTVRFNLSEPAPYLLNVMMTPYHVVVAPELIGTELLDTWAIGSGPFVLSDWEVGVSWVGDRNPTYFRKDPRTGLQLPYLDRLEGLDNLSSREARFAAWATGDQVQLVAQDLFDLDELLDLQPDAVVQTTAPPPGWQPYILFKLQEEPWNDTRVRRALSLLMDREAQKEGIYNGFAAAGIGMDWTFFADDSTPWGTREWPWTFEELAELGGASEFDPAAANALLDAAGITPDNPLSFDLDFHSVPLAGLRLMELIVDQWQTNADGRLNVNFNPGEWLAWFAKLPSGDFQDLLGHFQYGPAQDPDQYTFGPMHSSSPGNFFGINDAEVDEWAQAQRTETDPEARQELWTRILRKDLSESWRLWTVNPYRIQARRPWMFNHSDTYNAWNPGWGEKGSELTWFHSGIEQQANA